MTLRKISSDLATQSPGYVDFLLRRWFVFNCSLFEKWSVMNMVCYERDLLLTDLLWTWSVMNGSVTSWSVLYVVCFKMWSVMNWSVMNVVCFQMWSVMNVVCSELVCYEGGLLWTWSVMNVVCYERVCYEQVCNERGLFWVVCCEWSVMNRSV